MANMEDNSKPCQEPQQQTAPRTSSRRRMPSLKVSGKYEISQGPQFSIFQRSKKTGRAKRKPAKSRNQKQSTVIMNSRGHDVIIDTLTTDCEENETIDDPLNPHEIDTGDTERPLSKNELPVSIEIGSGMIYEEPSNYLEETNNKLENAIEEMEETEGQMESDENESIALSELGETQISTELNSLSAEPPDALQAAIQDPHDTVVTDHTTEGGCNQLLYMCHPGAIPVLPTQDGELVYVMPDAAAYAGNHSNHIPMAGTAGTPLLVLSNNLEKGTVEASVLIDRPDFGQLLALQSGLGQDLKQLGAQIIPTPGYQRVDRQQQQPFILKKPKVTNYYMCPVEGCGKFFTTMAYMKYHQATHEGKRPLKCLFEGCEKTFTWPTHLKYHHLTHTNERLYHCPVEGCDKTFITQQRLDVHGRIHTGDKPFMCREEGCDKAFTTAGNLKNHRRVHSGERPYACQKKACTRRFCEYSSLKKHMLTHTGEKPYACEICGKCFSQTSSRNVHVKAHKRDGDIGQDVTLYPVTSDIYQDLGATEQAMTLPHANVDSFVTVTTQPPEGAMEKTHLSPNSILNQEETIKDKMTFMPGANTSGANVVVLTQPQEIASITTGYHDNQQTNQENMTYNSDLLNSELSQGEITSNIGDNGDISTDNSTRESHVESIVVNIDPILASDDDDLDQPQRETTRSPENKLTICE